MERRLVCRTGLTQQCRIKYVRTVGSRNDDHTHIAFETIHLDQQLVQGLFTFIVSTSQPGTALTPNRIDLVDEDDAGCMLFACSNISLTLEAPTPTNISTKSEPEMLKNGTFASPAMARASNVLPVPGLPHIKTPRGIRPPSFWNLRDLSGIPPVRQPLPWLLHNQPHPQKSHCCSYDQASWLYFSRTRKHRHSGRLLHLTHKKIQTAINSNIGNHDTSMLISMDGSSSGFASTDTPAFNRSLTSHGSEGE